MNIREWRVFRGSTQQRCAEALGVSQATLSKIECGSAVPSPQTAKRIEAATNGEVTAAELLGLNTDEPRTRAVRETGAPFESAPVRVSVPADLADIARKYGLDVEALIAEGGVPRLREAFKAAYIVRHKEAIEWANAYVREHGTPSEQLGMI